jgi:hypothetical protein
LDDINITTAATGAVTATSIMAVIRSASTVDRIMVSMGVRAVAAAAWAGSSTTVTCVSWCSS